MVGAVIGASGPEVRLGGVEQAANPDRRDRLGESLRPDLDRDPAEGRGTQRRLEPAGGDAADEAPQRLVLLHADHRIVVAGHADVGDKSGAAGEDAMVGARNMSVGAGYQTGPAVSEMGERRFFAGGLGVHVDDDVAGLPQRASRQFAIERGEGIVKRLHEDPPEQVDDEKSRPLGVLDDRRASARRTGGVIGRPNQARLPLDEDERFALVEGVVAERHRVDAVGQKLLEDRFGETEAAGGVLSIDDDEIEAPALAQERNLLDDRRAPRTSDDIADEEETHSAVADENGFLFGHNGVQALIMRLIRRRGDFANPVGDANGVNLLHRPQPFEASIIIARAVADAVAASVEAGEGHEEKVGFDFWRRTERFGNAHRAGRGRIAGPPEPEDEMRAAPDRWKGGRESLVRQGAEKRKRIRLFADRMEGGYDRGRPQAGEAQAFLRQAVGQAGTRLGGQALPPRERLAAQGRFRIGVSRCQSVTPIRQQIARSREGRWTVIPGAYVSRWAPYAKAHGLRQGQLPWGSYGPEEYVLTRHPAPQRANVGGRRGDG